MRNTCIWHGYWLKPRSGRLRHIYWADGTRMPNVFCLQGDLRVWEKCTEYMCVHPCCQCIVLCSPANGIAGLLGRRSMVEVNKFPLEPYFFACIWLFWTSGFLYILVAIDKVSHNSVDISKIWTFSSMEVNSRVFFLHLLQKNSKLFFLNTLLKDQLFLSHLPRLFFFS